MEEKEKKKQIAKISIFITSVFVIFLSITYAFISMTLQGTKKQVITAGSISLELQEDENNITISDALPMYDEVGMIQEPFTFRLINNTANDTSYILKLVDITTGDKLSTSDVKYYLTKDGVGSPALLSILTDGQVDSGTIAGNQTIEYTLRLWIDSSVTENSAISGKSLSYRIDVEVSQIIERRTASSELITQADTEFVPDFSKISSATNGRGLYKLPASVPTETGEDVYYYRGAVENNHVLFANICWEIVRTTETGGIKMIYDGLPVDGVCSNTGTASQIGTSAFNSSYTSPAYNGYMYGTVYSSSRKTMSSTTYILSQNNASSSSYYYADSYTYSGSRYTLVNTDSSEVVTHTWSSDYSSLKGYYTCRSESSTTCAYLYYIVDTDSSYMYTLYFYNGKTLSDVNTNLVFGTGYSDNGDGTYTLTDTTTIPKSEWPSNYSSLTGYYTCNSSSATCSSSDMQYITSTTATAMSLLTVGKYLYGNDVEWDGSNYTLKDTIESAPMNWSSDYTSVGNGYHYTCFTTGDSCSSVYYVYLTNSGNAIYIILSSGKTIEEAWGEMQMNTTNSTIKTTIDDWYKTNIDDLGYTEYLEDTVWCNDRGVQDGQYGGWIKDGNGVNAYLYYSAYSRLYSNKTPSLVCSNQNDKFTVESSNGNGALTYPVGLLTADEMALAGGLYFNYVNTDYYLYTGKDYWTLSPVYFDTDCAREISVNSNGYLNSNNSNGHVSGVRPVVSLRSGIEFTSGDGTSASPYVVKEIS